ncbi:ABC transporter permease [Dactylosporangium fulvum]|uniref:ABC transporter permease n=1 Tax=Dactylosporangium fulvum TaxID=53359 RepID=A0ABY5VUL9_9ACTN|nr:ABC transporter permease [Dactylosporangium fulvum]UWP80955.1 ABC transporter permease [Dactylosporangium fulvum]
MTTATAPSAYPAPIEALMPDARKLADQLGDIPSRNALMKEFKIGAPKANAIREALTEEGVRLRTRDMDLSAPRTLHVVPDLEPDTDTPDPTAPIEAPPVAEAVETAPQATGDGHPGTNITLTDADGLRAALLKSGRNIPTPDEMPPAVPTVDQLAERVGVEPRRVRRPRSWPVWVLALPAFVAIWSGWVGLGTLTGFGVVHPLPGIADGFSINTAITLPIGVETYAAYALAVWLSGAYTPSVRRFARWSAIGSLIFGGAGQVAYHLLTAAGVTHAPWWITTAVACLPVAVLGMGAALAHLIHANHQ